MKRRLLYVMVSMFCCVQVLKAQRVTYSPYLDAHASHLELAGKTASYYWVEKEEQRTVRHLRFLQQDFDIYDLRLRLVGSAPSFMIGDSVLKQYLVPGKAFFDRVTLSGSGNATHAILQRFREDGSPQGGPECLATFDWATRASHFLMARSEDKNRILLLCFQPLPASLAPVLHAFVFDENWKLIAANRYENPFLSQPMIQDDQTGYAAESFNSGALQLANDGQWIMAAPSRTNNNFLLFHFSASGTLSSTEIALPEASQLEDVAISIDNESKQVLLGLLSRLHYPALKNVEVARYSMETKRLDFDSSYRFNTLPGAQWKNGHIIHESFVTVPGSGCVLLKEYGRPYTSTFEEDGWDPAIFFAGTDATPGALDAVAQGDSYLRWDRLTTVSAPYQRGNLSIFYFPAARRDSSWSGLVNEEQTTEMNSPNLSYLLITENGQLTLLYNSFLRSGEQFGTSVLLDRQGHLLRDAGAAFWKYNIGLDFQGARQIDAHEVAVPYRPPQRKGFAIISF